MKKNKNIDELFKDRFKNFEATPSPEVWNNIQAKLKEEDDRKVIPLWFKLGGIAALLALIFTIGNSILISPINQTDSPIVTENPSVIDLQKSNDIILDNNDLIKEEIVSIEDDHKATNNKEEIIKKSSENKEHKINNSETTVASNNNNSKVSEKSTLSELIKESEEKIDIQTGVANEKSNSVKDNNESLINKETEVNKSVEAVAVNEEMKNNFENPSETINTEAVKEENKKSIFDAINENPEEEVVIANVDNTPDNRWEVTPNVAPVYYNTLSEGSSIDPSFADNSKSGDLNIAYGVKVSYNLNKRLSVRSGLSNVNLSYSTTGLDIGTGPVAAASTSSIDYQGRSNVTIVVDKGALVNQNPDDPFGNVTPKSTNGEAYLNQKLSYYEMPLELNYAIINKRFGINVIGGFSTLLLGDNEVSVEAGDFNEVLGEANNLSSLSFTTNVGVGLNYSFSKKLMFNVEPMFKYQLNPYTDSSVNFKPYYIGIYSGLSFKF